MSPQGSLQPVPKALEAFCEAFRAGEEMLWRETNPAKWKVNFDYPAVTEGKVTLASLPHQRPAGIEGFAMNTRSPLFADWRVREAMILAFHFELVNSTLNAGALPRISSYFANSPLSGDVAAPANDKVRALLQPYAADLLPGTHRNAGKSVSPNKDSCNRVESDGRLDPACGDRKSVV